MSVALYANVSGYVAGIKTAQAATGSFLADLEKSQKKQQALKSLGNAAGIMGVGFAAAAGAAVFFAARFDQAMSKVQAATHESAANMDLLRDAAIEAGAKTQYSASEAAGAIEALAKAGLKTSDILGATGGLNGALSLAAAGGQEVADAAESMASALNQFGLQGSSASHVADLLAAGAGKASGEVSDLSMALNQTGLIAHSTGLSIEETVGALAEFASKGLLGSDAGTSFKNMLQRMNPQTEKAQALVEQYNISAFDQQGNFIGLAKYAEKLHDGLGGLTDQQRQSTMATIFGTDSVRAATILYQDGAKGVDKWTNAVNDQGYAAETAAIKMDNLAGDIEQLKGSLETALIGTGEGAQGPLRGLTQDLTKLTNAYIALPQPVKSTMLATAAFLAVAGGGIFVLTRLVTGAAAAGAAMETLGVKAATANTVLSTLGKGVAVFAIAELATQLKKVSDFTDTMDLTGLTKDLELFGQTGAVTGDLMSNFGADLGGVTRSFAADGKSLGDTLDYVAARGTTDKIESFLSGGDEWVDRVKELDAGLAQLHGQNPREAAKVFGELGDMASQSAGHVVDLTGVFPAYEAELQRAAAEAAKHTLALIGVNDGNIKLWDTTTGATGAIQQHSTALDIDTEKLKKWVKASYDAANAMLSQRHDSYALAQVLNDAKASIDGITGGLNKNTAAGQENEAKLEAVINQWNNSKTSAKQAAGAYEETRQTLINMLEAMGKTPAEAKKMAAALLGVPDVVRVARLETAQAQQDAKTLGIKLSDVKAPDLKAKLDILDALAAAKRMGDSIANVLSGIPDEGVKVTLTAQAQKILAALSSTVPNIFHASGGRIVGPGSGTSDSVPAMLSTGEHVWTADEVKKAGGHPVMEGLRHLARLGELPKRGDVSMFAGGGPVIRPAVSSAGVGASANKVESMFEHIATAIGIALSKKLSNILTHLPTAGQLGPGGVLSPAQLVRGQGFASAQVGKPYIWGGVGPDGYDCSGFQSAILNSAMGMNPYSRRGSTATMPWSGSAPGVGGYTIGWTTNAGDGIGHTSGNVGGLNVESYGGHGPAVGSGARSPLDSMFNGLMHYDQGGVLRPGFTLAHNGTGVDEHVFHFAKGGAVGSGISTAIHQTAGGDQMTAEQLAHAIAMAWKHFGFGPNATADKVKSELHDLISALRDALGKDAPVLDRLKKLGDNLIKAAKAQDRVSAHLDALRDRMDAYAATVAGNFRNDPFGLGVEGLETQLKADRNDARRMQRALRQARKKGLSGGLLKELAASGDFGTAQEIAAMSPAQIHHLEVLYRERQKASGSLGQYAGQQVFGQQIKRTANELHHLNKRLHHLEQAIKHIGHHVEHGARKGTHDGARDGMREQGRRAAYGSR